MQLEGWMEGGDRRVREKVTNSTQIRGVKLGIIGKGTWVRGIPFGIKVRFQF
jgi:hypothetical protein